MRPRAELLERWLADLGSLGGIGLALGFVVFVGFLTSVSRLLYRVAPENRRLEPGQVWLNLIPLFNLIWMPVTVERVGESIRAEMAARGRHSRLEGYGKTTGLVTTLFLTVGALFAISFAYVLALICGIAYWSQLSGYSRRLRDEKVADLPLEDEGW